MSLESDIFDTLKGLVANRCYKLKAPEGVAVPYIVWQQIGGVAWSFLESTPVGKRNARIQVACWDEGNGAVQDVSNLARAAEEALINSLTLRASSIDAFGDAFDEATERYGTRQDFSINY